jgi:hypothetical protein
MPLALISAVACMQKSAMLVVPSAERDFAETKRILGAEKVTALVTSERRAVQLKSEAPASLKNALYPVIFWFVTLFVDGMWCVQANDRFEDHEFLVQRNVYIIFFL